MSEPKLRIDTMRVRDSGPFNEVGSKLLHPGDLADGVSECPPTLLIYSTRVRRKSCHGPYLIHEVSLIDYKILRFPLLSTYNSNLLIPRKGNISVSFGTVLRKNRSVKLKNPDPKELSLYDPPRFTRKFKTGTDIRILRRQNFS